MYRIPKVVRSNTTFHPLRTISDFPRFRERKERTSIHVQSPYVGNLAVVHIEVTIDDSGLLPPHEPLEGRNSNPLPTVARPHVARCRRPMSRRRRSQGEVENR